MLQAFAVRPSFPSVSRIRFGAQPVAVQTPEQKAEALTAELRTLVDADRQNAQPVFLRFDLDKIATQMRGFFTRQAQADLNPAPFMMNIAGGSGSGKSTLARFLQEEIPRQAAALFGWKSQVNGPCQDSLDVDSYYKDSSARRKEIGDERFFQETNLDEPDALTLGQAAQDVTRIKNGMGARTPFYDYATSSRYDGRSLKTPTPFFIYEGLFTLAHESLRRLADLKIFVDVDAKTRSDRFWARAPQRNVKPDAAGMNLFNRVMSMHDLHVQPSSAEADIVVNGAMPLAVINERLAPMVKTLTKFIYPQGRQATGEALAQTSA